MKNILIILITGSVITAAILLANITMADMSDDIPRQEVHPASSYFNMTACLKNAANGNNWVFDNAQYLDAADARSVASVKKHLAAMDSINSDSNFNRRALSNALTQELLQRKDNTKKSYQPDSLLAIIQWAEQFRYFAAFDSTNQLLYLSIYGFWLDYVSGKLASFSKEKPSLRHDFKFRYLITRCRENNYHIPVKVTSFEKFIDNILYSNWGHLFHATWNQSKWWLKLFFLILFVLLCQGVITVVKKIKQFIIRTK